MLPHRGEMPGVRACFFICPLCATVAQAPDLKWVPRRKLWVIQDNIESPARWVGGASPDGTANFVSARRIAVKPCAYGAPLRGCGA